MEKEYLDEPKKYGIKGMGNLLEKLKSKFKKDTPKPKRGGLNEITQLRMETADLLKKPLGQVQRLTKGWTTNELRDQLKTSKSFIKNPPALWWKLYKKDLHERKNKRTSTTPLLKDREKGRKRECEERQSTLF